ncbi:MAG TPA: F0F1 ATP synthase subunit A [Solirubrobacteraceae bacterium]|nr:F0F1 ATP synthase subunit A [Solirubrobacteraceae bacterium]
MSQTKKLLLWLGGIWVGGTILLIAILGFGHKNNSFQIQNEFKLTDWVKLGPLAINRAVFYLFLATILTIVTMFWIARRMQMRPNRVQTAVELAYSFIRDQIVGDNMSDREGRKWFPFLGTLFLFLWFSNIIGYLPLPTNTEEKFNLFGAHIPAFAFYAATANISVPLALAIIVFISFVWEGVRTQGPIGYLKSLIPEGVGRLAPFIFVLEVISTFMRLISLTVRLFANILAGHLIILFMAGGLAVILGLSFLGWFTLPAGIAVYLFELGLIATLQAFIFAILAAIYIGGATTTH